MENSLHYAQPATCFEEALPLGNGHIGAMVYGGYDRDRISLNHDTLWSGKPRRSSRPNAREAYLESRRLLREDRYAEAEALLERDFTADWSQAYMPLGNLYIECRQGGQVQDYRRQLDLQTAIASVQYAQGGVRFERTYFVSHPDNCLVLHITSDAPADYVLRADSQLKSAVTAWENRLYLTGECPSCVPPVYARDAVPIVYDGEGVKFAAIGAVTTDGNVRSDLTSLSVCGATTLTFVMCVETSFAGFDTLPAKPCYYPCETRLQATAAIPYPVLSDRHQKDHGALYNRVQADFGFPADHRMTDQRLKAENKDGDLGLVELLYNYGRYLIIAASREGTQATNLQGIWNEQFFAPWSSNYTLNINTEMNYWPVLMNNLAGLDLPVIDLAQALRRTGTAAAEDFYGARGWCAHHNADLWGHAVPVGMQGKGCLRYAFWNMSAGWLCRHAWEHYEYTLDTEFLRHTAYPLMQEAAQFYLDILVAEGNRHILTPTTSPENSFLHPRDGKISLARSCAMTQGILIDLFTNLSQAARVLSVNDSFIDEIRRILPTLNTYAVGSEGQLLEFDAEYPEPDIHHRHLSHLYGLYPGESITTGATPALADACRISLERRGDISTGWAMGWRVCLWAKLKDGDHALKLVKDQLHFMDPANQNCSFNGGTYPNLLDAHPPFQIDGNYGVCAGIALMLLQCEDGKIRILPALPRAFRNGSIRGLKAKGDITVDITWQDGRLKEYRLTATRDCTVTVATPDGERTVCLKAGCPHTAEDI